MPESQRVETRWRSSPPPVGPYEESDLSGAVKEMLEEARTIMPGIQAFIGFQLVAVFNTAFWERLTEGERAAHLVGILLNVVAIALVMTPPLFHRQRESGYDSAGMVRLATKVLTASSYPLIAAVALDMYVIGRLIGGSVAMGVVAAAVSLVPAVAFWYVMPHNRGLRERLRG